MRCSRDEQDMELGRSRVLRAGQVMKPQALTSRGELACSVSGLLSTSMNRNGSRGTHKATAWNGLLGILEILRELCFLKNNVYPCSKFEKCTKMQWRKKIIMCFFNTLIEILLITYNK